MKSLSEIASELRDMARPMGKIPAGQFLNAIADDLEAHARVPAEGETPLTDYVDFNYQHIPEWHVRYAELLAFAKQLERERNEARRMESELAEALKELLARYVGLVNSGDAGNWNPEEEPQVKAARAILAKAQ